MRTWLLLLALGLAACRKSDSTQAPDGRSCEQAIAQGISGYLDYREGNFMPGPGGPPAMGRGVAREVVVHRLTRRAEATSDEGTFFREVQTPLVATVRADSTGCFRLALPAGQYSLFVREAQGLYANRFDGQDHIFPIEVVAGQVSEIVFVIDYNAAY